MDFNFIRGATSKELEQFKAVCNQLLSRTYIVRTLVRPGKGRVNNRCKNILVSWIGICARMI